LEQLASPFKDEFLLQQFIDRLADQVTQRKAHLESLLSRTEQCMRFEKDMQKKMTSLSGDQIAVENLKRMYQWIN